MLCITLYTVKMSRAFIGPTLSQIALVLGKHRLSHFTRYSGPTSSTKRSYHTPANSTAVSDRHYAPVYCNAVQPICLKQKARLESLCGRIGGFYRDECGYGLLRLPQVRDYWSKSDNLSTPWFPTIMARDRFFEILRYSTGQKKVSTATASITGCYR